MATVKQLVDGVFEELRELTSEDRTFRNLKLERLYLYTDEFKVPPAKDWSIVIRPALSFKNRTGLLGNRMDETYFVDLIIILKLDATKTAYYFTNGLDVIESKLTHNTLNNIVQVVGNNVSYELLDMGESRTMTAIMRYVARKIIDV